MKTKIPFQLLVVVAIAATSSISVTRAQEAVADPAVLNLENENRQQVRVAGENTNVLPFAEMDSKREWRVNLTREQLPSEVQPRWQNGHSRVLDDEETSGPQDQSAKSGKRNSISLTKIDGRHWLVDANGDPFFAHGITHAGNAQAKLDYLQFSNACKKVGFNAYGYGCPRELRDDMPYLESWNHLVPISLYRGDGTHKFVDIFDPDEQARIEKGVKAKCDQSKNNPNCIGHCWTDLATWPLENNLKKNWVDFIRGLPEESAGQKAYQNFLTTWKGNDDQARDQAFLRVIAREYFRVIGSANRKYDPDHLVFGDRLSFYTYDADVLKEMLPWVDAIAFQPHFWGPFPKKEFDDIYEIAGKPILICDFAIRFKDGDQDVNSWKMSADSLAAAKAYSDYVRAAFETDYIVGVFWCNPVDTTKGFGKGGVKQGFFGGGLSERPGLYEAVKKLNKLRDEITPQTQPK